MEGVVMKCIHCNGELIRQLVEHTNGEWVPRWMCDCTAQSFREAGAAGEPVIYVHDPELYKRRELLGIEDEAVANPETE